MTHPIEAESLLRETEWLRRLAGSLAADRHGADDLFQEAWVTALERPPADVRGLRGWLAAVARNLARAGPSHSSAA